MSGESNCSCDCGRCARKTACPARTASLRAPVTLSGGGVFGSSRTDRGFAFAADVGSTTLALGVYDLATGEELAAGGARNPQADVAVDIVGRIVAAGSPDGLSRMKSLVSDALAELLARTCGNAGISPRDMSDGVVTGNTLMLHLLTGRSPAALARAPFKADWLAGCEETVCGCRVLLPPAIGAFAGADLTCAMISAAFDAPGPVSLLLDIGTNAEIALRSNSLVYVASAAAGSAFEGVGDGSVGSELIKAVAAYVRGGEIAPSGIPVSRSLPLRNGGTLSPQDISAIQTAKAAVAAGVSVILESAGVEESQIEEVFLAGGFGCALDADDAVDLGMLPRVPGVKTLSMGNAALTGAAQILLHPGKRAAASDLAARARVVRLGGEDVFSKRFIDMLPFRS